MITTKIIKSTFKKTLESLTPGTVVNFFGPSGKIVLDEKNKTERVFLAGNIGITPFRSMLTYAASKKLSLSLTLIVSFVNSEERVFYEELQMIQHKKRKIIYENELFTEAIIKKHVTDIHKPIYYIIGPPAMVESTKKLLEKLLIPEEKIITEEFIDY